jgi:hypothetical protein
MRRPVLTLITLAAAAGAFAGLGSIAIPAASADTSITATYPISGSTYIKAVNSTVQLGPGTLSSTVDLTTGAITSSTLTLPPATASFKEFGFVPVTATTVFTQVGAATGSLKNGVVTVTSRASIRLSSLKVGGLPIPVGRSCQTSSPATITVTSQSGFNVLSGGVVSGGYTIPRFSHCGLATPLINLTIPGPGNTISLTLGNATLS